MSEVITALIGAGAAILVCIINNNTIRAKTQNEIKLEIQHINDNNEKNTAVISERIAMLTEQIGKSDHERNDLIKRMYEVESEVERHADRLSRLEDYHK